VSSTPVQQQGASSSIFLGAAAGAALFGGVVAVALLGNRFIPSELSARSVRFLTSPVSGGVTGLALIGSGALIGSIRKGSVEPPATSPLGGGPAKKEEASPLFFLPMSQVPPSMRGKYLAHFSMAMRGMGSLEDELLAQWAKERGCSAEEISREIYGIDDSGPLSLEDLTHQLLKGLPSTINLSAFGGEEKRHVMVAIHLLHRFKDHLPELANYCMAGESADSLCHFYPDSELPRLGWSMDRALEIVHKALGGSLDDCLDRADEILSGLKQPVDGYPDGFFEAVAAQRYRFAIVPSYLALWLAEQSGVVLVTSAEAQEFQQKLNPTLETISPELFVRYTGARVKPTRRVTLFEAAFCRAVLEKAPKKGWSALYQPDYKKVAAVLYHDGGIRVSQEAGDVSAPSSKLVVPALELIRADLSSLG